MEPTLGISLSETVHLVRVATRVPVPRGEAGGLLETRKTKGPILRSGLRKWLGFHQNLVGAQGLEPWAR